MLTKLEKRINLSLAYNENWRTLNVIVDLSNILERLALVKEHLNELAFKYEFQLKHNANAEAQYAHAKIKKLLGLKASLINILTSRHQSL